MNTKAILTAVALLLSIASFSINKDVKTLDGGVGKFKAVSVSANIRLKVIEDSCYNVTVLSPDSILKKGIDYKVDNDGTLRIFDKFNDAKSLKPVNVIVSSPDKKITVKADTGYTLVSNNKK
jgi:hypothetical protein